MRKTSPSGVLTNSATFDHLKRTRGGVRTPDSAFVHAQLRETVALALD
jgi:hypothetical protein